MHKKTISLITLVTLIAVHQLNQNKQSKQYQSERTQLRIQSLQINFQNLFQEWQHQFHKNYRNDEEYHYRLKVFISNCRKIYHHNENMDQLGYTHSLGLNQFSDRTKQQYLDLLNAYPSKSRFKSNLKIETLNDIEQVGITLQCTGTITTSPNPPQQVDWSKKAVTPVLNQGQCGSSYAIAAIGALEGIYALRIGKLETFSIQQILDCSGDYGNQGCFGGFMDQAFWYLIDNGAATVKSYPNKNSTDAFKCVYTKSMRTASISKCADVPSQSYIKLQSAVIQQPTAVAIDASQLQHYEGGIYNGNCSDTAINQAMLVVGYGQEDNATYWKLKNSMGTTWGESGYFYLERQEKDGHGKCGVQLMPAIPQSLG